MYTDCTPERQVSLIIYTDFVSDLIGRFSVILIEEQNIYTVLNCEDSQHSKRQFNTVIQYLSCKIEGCSSFGCHSI